MVLSFAKTLLSKLGYSVTERALVVDSSNRALIALEKEQSPHFGTLKFKCADFFPTANSL